MNVRSAVAGAAKKIAGKLSKTPEKEDLVLGADALPNGVVFKLTSGGDKDPHQKKPTPVG
ncbi:MAG: hypothetical protein KBD19_03395 [Candidatus Moranbacteria bacterium]|nr:hypothetical protein [Candidatus Moranbacteria bacterium]